jgi:hypothetical protein
MQLINETCICGLLMNRPPFLAPGTAYYVLWQGPLADQGTYLGCIAGGADIGATLRHPEYYKEKKEGKKEA